MSTPQYFVTSDTGSAVLSLVDVMQANREMLSEIDGAIGDGDHGINMSTGFLHFREAVASKQLTFGHALVVLGTTLLEVTGGSLGPLYGSMFIEMGTSAETRDTMDAAAFIAMLEAGRDSMMDIGGARPGDKTLLDCLCPAIDAFNTASDQGASFADSLIAMQQGAEAGKESTRGMIAKIGRASRLGERSRGVLDAGASSCCLILTSLADSLRSNLKPWNPSKEI
ncbi:MAG: dihydroxyacetone kinase subunit DhaL, partial [Acidobacteriota bacterium]